MTTDTVTEARLLPNRQQAHHLVNAEREARRRGLFDVPIVDCDSHCYETVCFSEIIAYIENPNIRRAFETSSLESIQANLIPQNLGDRNVGGRIRAGGAAPAQEGVYPLDEPAGGLHPVAATAVNSMNAMAIDYSILFP